jgi:hypothetical protein
MTAANWAQSNGFTRMVTIAAVCNRAQFSYGEDDAAAVSAAPAPAAPSAATASAPPTAGAAAPAVGDTGGAVGSPDALEGGPEAQSVHGSGGAAAGPGSSVRGGGVGGGGGGGGGAVAAMESPTKAAAASSLPPAAGASTNSTDRRKVLGDASEAALLRYCDSLVPVFEFRAAYPAMYEIPFNSVNKWAYTVRVRAVPVAGIRACGGVCCAAASHHFPRTAHPHPLSSWPIIQRCRSRTCRRTTANT